MRAQSGLAIDYRGTTAEALAAAGERFDIVLAMEVIEHVADHDVFLDAAPTLVGPGRADDPLDHQPHGQELRLCDRGGGILLRLLPRGTHQWERFLKPEEIGTALGAHGLRTSNVSGVTMNLLSRRLQLRATARQFHHDGGAGVGRARRYDEGSVKHRIEPLPAATPMAGTACALCYP